MIKLIEKMGTNNVKEILKELAKRYCHCIEHVKEKGNEKPYGICNKSVFHTKGLKGMGRGVQCNPVYVVVKPIKSKNRVKDS